MVEQQVDAIVVGAGLMGLACARQLAKAGLETIVLEKEPRFGQGISSRNSEVIHAGIYYEPGSDKARFCRVGRELLYAYAVEHQIPHRQVGKLIVANGASQVEALERLAARARMNGCDEVVLISEAKAKAIEPDLRCDAAIDSPRTGIIDSHALMLSLLGEVQEHGGYLVLGSEVMRGEAGEAGLCLETGGSAVHASYVVNAAGLEAPTFARRLAGFPSRCVPEQYYAKGSYFFLSGESPFGRLIYPAPEPGGLGIHLTLDIEGRARFGPDVEWVTRPDYAVDCRKRDRFSQAIRTYWPGCDADRLHPGYAGVRPKLGPASAPAADFLIQGPETHGIPGLVNLFGIESPGLTACLAIAEEVVDRLSIQ